MTMSGPDAGSPTPPPRRLSVRLLIAGSVLLVVAFLARSASGARLALAGVALVVSIPMILVDPPWFRRAMAAVGRLAGAAVGTVVFTALGLLVLPLPWLLHRLAGFRPLPSSTGFRPRRRTLSSPGRHWAADTSWRRATGSSRVSALTAVAAVVALLAVPSVRSGLGDLASSTDRSTSSFEVKPAEPDQRTASFEELVEVYGLQDPVDPGVTANTDPNASDVAMKSSSWFFEDADYSTAQGWAFDPANAWRPVNLFNMLDLGSRHLNLENGTRRTWRAPPCECRRLTVWIYGGSTTFGLNQRDGHTIASYLGRIAYENDMVIDVVNRGSNGQLHWVEASRFAWDLRNGPAPDLTIFYDGVNDPWAGVGVEENSFGLLGQPVDPTLVDLWASTGRAEGPVPEGPEGSGFARPVRPTVSALDLAQLTMERYDQSRRISSVVGAANDVPIRYFWQPSRYSRSLVPSEPHPEAHRENGSRLQEQLLIRELADDVIDLSDALDGTTEPLFTDDVHHNEEGARLIAQAMFERLRPDLLALGAQTPRGGQP